MGASAAVLALMAVLLAGPLPQRLARQQWPAAAPAAALVLWQSVGLAGGLAAIGALALAGLAPLGPDLYSALARLPGHVGALGPLHLLALAGAAVLTAWLVGVFAVSTLRTLRSRSRHRALLALVADRDPALDGVRVIPDAGATAYCLPGLRPEIVVSEGALEALDPAQLAAVLAHERAHAGQRHDLVVLPFVALLETFPRLPSAQVARREVALLVAMLADDRALRSSSRAALAGALQVLAPDRDALHARRVARLLRPPAVPAGVARAAEVAGVALVLSPTLVLLGLPLLRARGS